MSLWAVEVTKSKRPLRDGVKRLAPFPGRLASLRKLEAEIRGNLSADTIEQLGFSVVNLTGELASELGYEGDSGVVVREVQPGSEADQAGIEPPVGLAPKTTRKRNISEQTHGDDDHAKAETEIVNGHEPRRVARRWSAGGMEG